MPVGKLINSNGISYHQFADDTAIKSLSPSSLAIISTCTDAVTGWHITSDLLLDPMKTEALVTCARQQVTKLDQSGGTLVFGIDVPLISKLWEHGVLLNCYLSLDDHIKAWSEYVATTRALHHICPLINRVTANTIACSVVCRRLGYCNSVLYAVTESNRSSPASLKRTGMCCMYCTILCTCIWLTNVTYWFSISSRLFSR